MVEETEEIEESNGEKQEDSEEKQENIESSAEEVKVDKPVETDKPVRNTSEKDNIIYVGIKPFMNYVTGVVMQFQNKGQDEVIVSARGKFISKSVDVVEVARRTFLKDENIKIENINISSEPFENKEGRRIFVSSIEIKLIKR